MKILHLNTYEKRGGAARAVGRLHNALKAEGVDSEVLVSLKENNDDSIKLHHISLHKKKIKLSKTFLSLQASPNPTQHSCNIFPSGIHKIVNQSNADIVHLHWVGDEFISIAEIKKITKPLVWTMHDMWAFCGNEHCDNVYSSGRYRQVYSRKNKPSVNTGKFDLDAWTWRRKLKHWKELKVHFVAPSQWMSKCLANSELFRHSSITVIPNCIDIDKFFPLDKIVAREKLGLSVSKKILLVGAVAGGGNPLKGYHLFVDAVKTLLRSQPDFEVDIAVFGGKPRVIAGINGAKVYDFGFIDDDEKIRQLYSAVDIYISPSMMESFGQTVLESISCGTPVVAFRVGGIKDIIKHKVNGYLANPFDAKDLSNGIRWIIESSTNHKNLSDDSRNIAVQRFQYKTVAKDHISLYRRIIG